MNKPGSGFRPRHTVAPALPHEDAEFRIEVADAIPLPAPNRVQHLRRLPKPIARQRLRDEQQVMHDALHDPFDWDAAVAAGDELLFVRPGVPTAAVRKLKRGGWVLRAELDLHGMNGDESPQAYYHALMYEALRVAGKHDAEPVQRRWFALIAAAQLFEKVQKLAGAD